MLIASSSVAQFRYDSTAFRDGENLTYRVRWGFIRLGTVTVHQEYADSAFPQFMQVWINGVSAAGLPFINVFFRSTGLLNVSDPVNILYELIGDEEERNRTTYVYDPMNRRMFALQSENGDLTRLDTLEAPVPYYDGPGLFMYSRCVAGSDTTVALPTVMDFALGLTTISFSGVPEQIDVPAYDEERPAYRYSGSADWHGSSFAGMTGDFEGWVATDSTRIVLKAAVKIFLGSVTLELESVGKEQSGDER